MPSVLGNKIKISVFGESHGAAIGCVIDGLPAGIRLDMDKIYKEMARRAPGKDKTSTTRKESDTPNLLSGVLNGITTGAPLAMIIENTNTRSGDYGNLMTVPRPGHSDYPAYVKYQGNNDIRGGGHFSGRLTAPIVFAGAVAKQILEEKGIKIGSHISKIAGVCDDCFDKNNISSELLEQLSNASFSVINSETEAGMREAVEHARLKGNSVAAIYLILLKADFRLLFSEFRLLRVFSSVQALILPICSAVKRMTATRLKTAVFICFQITTAEL